MTHADKNPATDRMVTVVLDPWGVVDTTFVAGLRFDKGIPVRLRHGNAVAVLNQSNLLQRVKGGKDAKQQ